jgi:large repetitive protein
LDFTMTFGGSLENAALGIAVDNAGNTYVTGYTFSSNFPWFGALLGTPQCTGDACDTPFVTKLSPQGEILFSSYFGGTGAGATFAEAIAADSTGAFITGLTSARDFITNATYAFGSNNAFVADLDPSGDSFHWVVGLGGGTGNVVCEPNGPKGAATICGLNASKAIALDAQHAAYIAGYTTALDFPTTEYFQGQHKSWQPVFGASACPQSPLGFCQNGFVAKVPSTGNFDDGGYSTYIGGSVLDTVQGIAVDGTGHASVTGSTYSPDFPALTSNAGLAPAGGGNTAFVTRLLPDGSGVVYSNFLGGHLDPANGDGPPNDNGYAIAVDSAGHAYTTGSTCSANFPTTPGAVQMVQPAPCSSLSSTTFLNVSGFITVFSPVGGLMYSTYVGGPAPEGENVVITVAQSIAINPRDEIYVGGSTSAVDILGNNNPLQSASENTGFVAKLTPDLSQAMFVNFIGEEVDGVAVQPPCAGLRCIIESRRFGYKIWATGGTFLPGANVTNPNNLQVFVSKSTDDSTVTPPPKRHQ